MHSEDTAGGVCDGASAGDDLFAQLLACIRL